MNSCHGMEEVMEPKRIKKPPSKSGIKEIDARWWGKGKTTILTQAIIDGTETIITPPLTRWQRFKDWLDGPPGGLITVLLSAIIVLTLTYWLCSGWTASDAVITAGRG